MSEYSCEHCIHCQALKLDRIVDGRKLGEKCGRCGSPWGHHAATPPHDRGDACTGFLTKYRATVHGPLAVQPMRG